MRKVTTINLNGRAYQLEEPAYDKLQAYLRHAETTLAKNPDKAEVLGDIEQAIADKCEGLLAKGKNVVTSEQITEILKQMGEVESGEADDEQTVAADTSVPRRLFIIREGAMFMGVCKGIGAYLGVEPNLVRLAFILLTIFTGGFWILVYILLGLFLPTAKTDAERAEAFGKPLTAHAIVERARERAPDPKTWERPLQVAVGFVAQLMRIAARVVSLAGIVVFSALTGAWVWVVWQLLFGRLQFYEQLKPINGWRAWLAVTALYLLAALPALLIARLFYRIATAQQQSRLSTMSESSLAVLWGLALVTLIAFGTAYAQNFRDYANAHAGHIKVGNNYVCVDSSRCDNGDGSFHRQQKLVVPQPLPPLPPDSPKSLLN